MKSRFIALAVVRNGRKLAGYITRDPKTLAEDAADAAPFDTLADAFRAAERLDYPDAVVMPFEVVTV
jgi:hypothetical protein